MRDHEVVRRFDLLRLSRGDYWIIIKCGLLIAASAFVVAGILAVVTSTESWSYVCTPADRHLVLPVDDLGGRQTANADSAGPTDYSSDAHQAVRGLASSLTLGGGRS